MEHMKEEGKDEDYMDKPLPEHIEGDIIVRHVNETGASMKKQFGAIATLGLAFSVMNSWTAEGISLYLYVPLGGSVTVLWGCVAAAVFTAIVSVGLAELTSAFPGAGGPYHYTFMVASERNRKSLSFIAGWSVTLAWWFALCGTALFGATFVTGLAMLWHPDYVPTSWETFLIFVGIMALSTSIAVGFNGMLSLVTSLSLYWSLSAFLVCIITVVAMHRNQPYESASFVFGSFSNGSGWPNKGTAFVIGWMLSTVCFLGIDAVTHFSEEMERPEVEVPRAMVGTILIGLTTSFCFLISLLFCITDLHEASLSDTLEGVPLAGETYSGQVEDSNVPIITIFDQATGSKAAATALTTLIFVAIMFAVTASVAIAGRTTWAFARDNGMPFSKYLSVIDETTRLPLRATLLSSSLAICYGAIYVGSAAAFNAIVGSAIIMVFTAYVLPQGILAVRGRHHLPPHPFDLGPVGLMFNIAAPILVAFAVVVLCLPDTLPVTPVSMNYLSVIAVGCWVLIIGFYVLVKKGHYEGPIVESAPSSL